MEDFYKLLGVSPDASSAEIKKAFREQAKKIHPDIAGAEAEAEARMRDLIHVYETLVHTERRNEYDHSRSRYSSRKEDFNYRDFLKRHPENEEFQAKLVFFDLLNLREDEAIETWKRMGGANFRMDSYLEREDWMDCMYILAEELDKRGDSHEAFWLLTELIREERRLPYFKHFAEDVELLAKEIVRLRVRHEAGDVAWVECLEELISLGFTERERQRWQQQLDQALGRLQRQGWA